MCICDELKIVILIFTFYLLHIIYMDCGACLKNSTLKIIETFYVEKITFTELY